MRQRLHKASVWGAGGNLEAEARTEVAVVARAGAEAGVGARAGADPLFGGAIYPKAQAVQGADQAVDHEAEKGSVQRNGQINYLLVDQAAALAADQVAAQGADLVAVQAADRAADLAADRQLGAQVHRADN